jgi:hypothetical protein
VFTEDIGAFFNQSEFAVQAVFTPAGGGAPVSASVLFNAQTQEIFGNDVLSEEYTIVYASNALPGVKSGDYGTVNGAVYRVRDVRMKADGQLFEAKLSKAPVNG